MPQGCPPPSGRGKPAAVTRVWSAPAARGSRLRFAVLLGIALGAGAWALGALPRDREGAPGPAPVAVAPAPPAAPPDSIFDGASPPVVDGPPPVAPDLGRHFPRSHRTVAGHRGVLLVDPYDRRVSGRVVLDYDGKYARDPRWQARVSAIVAGLQGDVDGVRRRLGMEGAPEPRFCVRFCDAAARDRASHMTTYAELRGGELWHCIMVESEPLVAGEYDLQTSLRHELVHCWQMASLEERFWQVPRWIVEGLADWGADGGEGRLDATCLCEAARPGGDPAGAIVDGLDGPQSFGDYAEAYLAFRMVEEERGPEVARRLAAGLVRDANYGAALKEATGLDYRAFEGHAREWARKRVEARLADRPAYLVPKARFLARDYAGATPLYEEYLAREATGVFRPLALLELGMCRSYCLDTKGARSRLAEAAACGPRGLLARSLDLWSIRVGVQERDMAAVAERCRNFLLDYEDHRAEVLDEVRKDLHRAEESLAAPHRPPKGSEKRGR